MSSILNAFNSLERNTRAILEKIPSIPEGGETEHIIGLIESEIALHKDFQERLMNTSFGSRTLSRRAQKCLNTNLKLLDRLTRAYEGKFNPHLSIHRDINKLVTALSQEDLTYENLQFIRFDAELILSRIPSHLDDSMTTGLKLVRDTASLMADALSSQKRLTTLSVGKDTLIRIRDTLDGFPLVEKSGTPLAKGATGVVRLAEQRDSKYATKDYEKNSHIMLREESIKVLLGSHPNVMPFISIDRETTKSVMPRGKCSLNDLTSKGLNRDQIIEIMLDLTNGLRHIHERGIYHRDLKPMNVIMMKDRAVITDFDISEFADGKHATAGTLHFMSPETLGGDAEITAASDIYSLGMILYTMISGEKGKPYENYASTLLHSIANRKTGVVPFEKDCIEPLVIKGDSDGSLKALLQNMLKCRAEERLTPEEILLELGRMKDIARSTAGATASLLSISTDSDGLPSATSESPSPASLGAMLATILESGNSADSKASNAFAQPAANGGAGRATTAKSPNPFASGRTMSNTQKDRIAARYAAAVKT